MEKWMSKIEPATTSTLQGELLNQPMVVNYTAYYPWLSLASSLVGLLILMLAADQALTRF